MRVLVTGGAGYIGSIVCRQLTQKGFEVVVLDSLENGSRQAAGGLKLVKGKTHDQDLVKKTLAQEKIEAVMHCAGYIAMGESMENPAKYFDNNVVGAVGLFEAMAEAGVTKIIFSSTAGVYGNPERVPIKEEDSKLPENPYGESKLMVEKMLDWYDRIQGLRSISLRYFNAAGAALDGSLGEAHRPESHLIPNVIRAAMTGDGFKLYGNDYPTPDGTCIRDYIHVLDLADAHILALKSLEEGKTKVYNLGTGTGHSVNEVIDMCRAVTMHQIPTKVCEQRQGDPPMLVASAKKIEEELDWKPQYSLSESIASAWDWHRKNPGGYA